MPGISHGWFTPEMETIEEYISRFGYGSNPLFKGYEHYEILLDAGYLIPDRSVIRLLWGFSRGDEGFYVTGDYQLRGMDDIKIHTARSGVFDPKDILGDEECPMWEAYNLRREPKPRKHK